MALAIGLTLITFVGGVVLAWWQARRRFRRRLADRIAREVEQELARRALAGFAADKARGGAPRN